MVDTSSNDDNRNQGSNTLEAYLFSTSIVLISVTALLLHSLRYIAATVTLFALRLRPKDIFVMKNISNYYMIITYYFHSKHVSGEM